jgi:hypothetical protein
MAARKGEGVHPGVPHHMEDEGVSRVLFLSRLTKRFQIAAGRGGVRGPSWTSARPAV